MYTRIRRRAVFFIFWMLLLFPVPGKCEEASSRGLFITAIQDPPVLSSREDIAGLIDFAKGSGITVLFVQIYRANRAWFPSRLADDRPYRDAFKKLSEDPFALLIRQAHAAGIRVHAWLNLLSLSTNKDALLLKKYGPGILTRNLNKKKILNDYKIDNQFFLEPGDLRVREDLSGIVEEVLCAYPSLDGIQFDYIRYPDKNPAYGYTQMNVRRFKKALRVKRIQEESKAWKDWKRAQVSELVELLAKKTRAFRPHIQISCTGCAPYSRALHEAFQDWPSWLTRGLVDFVTIMSYTTDNAEFKKDISEARNNTCDFKKVNIAVGAYKMVDSPETFQDQYRLCEETGCKSCVIFHYGSVLKNPALGNFLSNATMTANRYVHTQE